MDGFEAFGLQYTLDLGHRAVGEAAIQHHLPPLVRDLASDLGGSPFVRSATQLDDVIDHRLALRRLGPTHASERDSERGQPSAPRRF